MAPAASKAVPPPPPPPPPPKRGRRFQSKGTHSVELSCCDPHTWKGMCVVVMAWYHWGVGKSWAVQAPAVFLVTAPPPSLPTTMWDASSGSIHMSWKSPWVPLATDVLG